MTRLASGSIVTAVAVAAAGLVAFAGMAQAEFMVYDNFASKMIDPEKWQGVSLEGGFGSPSTQFVRAAQFGGLRLVLDSYGGTGSDSGAPGTRQGLAVRQLTPFITGLEARVTVLGAAAQDCAANLSGGAAQARLIGSFFNDDTSPDPVTNAIGNVLGIFALSRITDQTQAIAANLARCTTADCAVAEILPGTSVVTFAMPWSTFRPVVMRMSWDQAGHFVRFVASTGGATETHDIAYPQSDVDPPAGFDFKQVRVQNFTENCTTGRRRNHIDALIDDVKVQRAAP